MKKNIDQNRQRLRGFPSFRRQWKPAQALMGCCQLLVGQLHQRQPPQPWQRLLEEQHHLKKSMSLSLNHRYQIVSKYIK